MVIIMKKLLLLLFVSLMAVSVFAKADKADVYPFAAIVFPAVSENNSNISDDELNYMGYIVSRFIDENKTFSAMSFNKNNILIKDLVNLQILNEDDLLNVNPADDGARISEAMGANGYVIYDIPSFKIDRENNIAEVQVSLKIFKNGQNTPFFDKTVTACIDSENGFNPKNSDEKIYDKLGKLIKKEMKKAFKNVSGFDYQDVKVVEMPNGVNL